MFGALATVGVETNLNYQNKLRVTMIFFWLQLLWSIMCKASYVSQFIQNILVGYASSYQCKILCRISPKIFRRIAILLKQSRLECWTIGAMTLSIMTFSLLTLSIMPLSIMSLSIMTLSILTLSRATLYIMALSIIQLSTKTLSIMGLSITRFRIMTHSIKYTTLRIKHIQYNNAHNTQHMGPYSQPFNFFVT